MARSGWHPMASFPLAARYGETVVWTGDELIVWGGYAAEPLGDGARYDPKTDRWTPVSTKGAPSPRWLHGGVWTGKELAVWGGDNNEESDLADGGLYDPKTDRWRPIVPFEWDGKRLGRNSPGVAWTGAQLLVWGGSAEDCDVGLGGVFDPAAGAWRPMTEKDEPTRRHEHASIWTGNELLVWGGMAADKSTGDDTGGLYDPVKDSWRPIPKQGAPKPRFGFVAEWTGKALLVWGGCKGGKTYPADGGVFDPQAGVWTPIKRAKTGPSPRLRAASGWTGEKLMVWGGFSGDAKLSDGAIYDPANQTWQALPTDGSPSPRSMHAGVWTGEEFIVWGGQARHDALFTDGARYVP